MRRHAVAAMVVAVVASTAVGGTLAFAGSARTPVLSIVPSQSPPAPISANMLGVACPTKTGCFAVGSYIDHFEHNRPVVARSVGGRWSAAAAPVPGASATAVASLSDVACTTPNRCFAVGASTSAKTGHKSLIERWDGTHWAVVANPNPARAVASQLSGIACPTSTLCFAVGYWYVKSAVHATLVERWDGTRWSVVPSPNSASASGLARVSCASSASCFAVGNSNGSGLIERWNGSTWSIVASPVITGATSVTFSGVSCASATLCAAVGQSHGPSYPNDVALLEQWNGAGWSVVTVPLPDVTYISRLSEISCPAVTSCFAAGYADANGGRIVIDRWDGTSWSLAPALTPPDVSFPLNAISCASPSACTAVGDQIMETWDGTTWSFLRSGGSSATFDHVSCSSMTRCSAVGHYFDLLTGEPYDHTFLARWNGASWKIVPGAQPAGLEVHVASVSCRTGASCFAVGSYGESQGTAIEQWNGTTWSIVPSPNSQTFANALFDISCPSATSCFAVGVSRDVPLVEQWDGSSWSIVANVPLPPDATGNFYGISCVSATSCLAVGVAFPSSGNVPLVERWDGTAWSIVAAPYITLTSVSCWSSTGCFAVGAGYTRVLAWNGTKWSVAVTDPDNSLHDVSCSSGTSCLAVGGDDPGFGSVSSAEHWDGKHWSLVVGPKPSGAIGSGLSGVSCVTGAGCLAVGSYLTGISQWTLAERFS